MKNFGFKIAQPRILNMDERETSVYQQLIEAVSSVKACFYCGTCAATCSYSENKTFSLRKLHLIFQRAAFKEFDLQSFSCLLCGKCMMLCPRAVHTRASLAKIRVLLHELAAKKA